jgi:hypothetical protein
MPLRIPFPFRREQEIVIHLPDNDWNISDAEKTIEQDAFLFHYRRTLSGKVLRYNFECETKTPELPPQKVADYLVKLDEMETEVGEKLTMPDNDSKHLTGSLNWLMIVVAAFGSVFTLAIMLWAWRATRNADRAEPPLLSFEERQLQGLGGWLILVGFGLCLTPITRVAVLIKNWEGYFSVHVWQTFAMPQSEQYHPLYAPLLIFEMLGNIAILGLTALVICFFFAKRNAFPKMFILLLWSNTLFLTADELFCRQIPFLAKGTHGDSIQTIARIAFMAVIWSAYMVRSRRVKATFIR